MSIISQIPKKHRKTWGWQKPGLVIPGKSDNGPPVLDSGDSDGLKIDCRIDYLRIKAQFDSQKSLNTFLEFVFNSHPYNIDNVSWSAGRGAKKFDNRITTLGGGFGGISYHDENCQSGDIMIDLPGEYWGQFDVVSQHNIFSALKNIYHCECTRLDICIDDYSQKIVPINQMLEATENLNVSGFHADKYKLVSSRQKIESKDKQTFKIIPVDTHYFGSRQSDKFTRVYKHVFSEGLESLRYEVEFKGVPSSKVFEILADYPYDKSQSREQNLINISQNLASIALGAIDFVDKKISRNPDGSWDVETKRKHLTRCKRFDWWQRFIDLVADGLTLKIKVGTPIKSLEKTVQWLKRQVIPSLASLMIGANVGQIHSQLEFIYQNVIERNGGEWYEILHHHARENPGLVASVLSV